MVNFQPAAANNTRISLRLNYDPEGIVENVGDWLGIVGRRVEGDLKRFKDYIQSQGHETGSWRGQVQDPGTVSREPSDSEKNGIGSGTPGAASGGSGI